MIINIKWNKLCLVIGQHGNRLVFGNRLMKRGGDHLLTILGMMVLQTEHTI